MSRTKAFTIHLAISATVVLTLGALLALTWYPPAYAWSMGGLGLIGILAVVDICLGPLLTGIVWNPEKPRAKLKFDLSVIALVQVLALSYGLYTVYLARPVYMAFIIDRFELVSAAEIPPKELAKATREEFRSVPLTGPKIIGVKKPDDPAERDRLVFASLSGGVSLQSFPKYYVPYAELAAEAGRRGLPVQRLLAQGNKAQEELNELLQEKGLDVSQVKFLPLSAKFHDQAVIIDGVKGEVLGIVDADPWANG